MKVGNGAWVYCFKRGKSAVFLNRKDQVIKHFESYEEAEKFANENMHLIDKRGLKDKKQIEIKF